LGGNLLECRLLLSWLPAMKSFALPSLLLLTLLTGCVQMPAATSAPVTAAPGATHSAEERSAADIPHPVPAETPEAALPAQPLTERILYEFMLAELASQRGHAELAAQASFDLAQVTQDPRLARRAAQLALEARQMALATQACQLWQKLEPDSLVARRMVLGVLLAGGKLDEARPHLAALLAAEPAQAGQVLQQTYPLLAAYPDKRVVLNWLRGLAEPYPAVAEAHWVLAQAAQVAQDYPLALAEIRQAEALRPDWDRAVMFEAQLLQQNQQSAAALARLNRYLDTHPSARDVRLMYARSLLDDKQLTSSREQFRKLAEAEPENADWPFAIALISLQLNELDSAESQLQRALERGNKQAGTVHYYLGQLEEARQNESAALAHYRQVVDGDSLYPAQMRLVYWLNKAGKLAEAREQVQHMQAATPQQRVQLALVESQLLAESNQHAERARVLQRALEKSPNAPELLYEAAMVADKLGDLAHFEQTLRRLIQLKPDSAQAYNALGYGWLERNVRVNEAVALVEKASQLEPDDPAIMDSLGWGYYRQGKLEASLDVLRRAYAANADPEIAAHLGEVLWATGDHGGAETVWRDSLKMHPAHPALLAVMKKWLP